MTSPTTPLDAPVASRLKATRVWVSGGHGFVGRRLVAEIRRHGGEPILFAGDIRHEDAVRDSIRTSGAAVLFNLAAPVDVTRDTELEETMRDTILGGACAVFDAAEAHLDGPLLIQVGTCEEYGTIDAPFAEDDPPSEPVSPYSRYKLAATTELLARTRSSHVRVVVARPFLTYGPGQRGEQLVPAAVRAAVAGRRFPMTLGTQTREFNYVDDTAMGLLRVAAAPELAGSTVNVAGGEEREVIDVVRRIFRLAGANQDLIEPGALPCRSGEVARFFADTRRCRGILRHRPSISLEEGLRRTIDALSSVGTAPE